MKMKNYTLKEISQWQIEVSTKITTISLPSLQRGFVWKPNQIEELWDSIFRGYPIGAIMMSVDEDENRFLLDGQQRCTSVALGHFNPFVENNKTFLSLKNYKPSIWIDLAPKEKTNGQEFVFRCLTQSHPWGYQLKENTSTLSMSNRRKALDYFEPKSESYLDLSSKDISPWDSYFPIPLAFVLEIECDDFENFRTILLKKTVNLSLKTQHSNNEIVDYNTIKDSDLELIYKGFCNYKKLTIPEICVDAIVLKEDRGGEKEGQDPSLFVRLNSAGTRISGEELIYSIYKAKFPEIKNLVESVGASYIAPSKIINLFSRLIIIEQNGFSSFQKDISIQNFKNKIKESDFQEKLQSYIGDENKSVAKSLIENALKIIERGQSNFPKILLKQLIVTNFELFLVLLTYIKKVGFENLNEIEKKQIASSYCWILWFSKDSKKIPVELFNLLFSNETQIGWEESTKRLITSQKVLPKVNPEIIQDQLNTIVIKNNLKHADFTNIHKHNLFTDSIKNLLFYDENNLSVFNENWDLIISKIYWNKSLLIYAQKEYMNSKFKEFNQFDSIEDTNRPWDWDHIYPDSWVYRKEGINKLVRAWVNCIGNFRALSYDDNRSENNHFSPKERFENDEKIYDSFIKDNDKIFWDKIDKNFGRIKDNEPEKTEIFLNAVISRMVNIYEEWLTNYINA